MKGTQTDRSSVCFSQASRIRGQGTLAFYLPLQTGVEETCLDPKGLQNLDFSQNNL